jgi:hypothetical protein
MLDAAQQQLDMSTPTAATEAADGPPHPGDSLRLQIPRVSAIAIHFPGYINPESPAAALSTFGGEAGLSAALGEQVIEVQLHKGGGQELCAAAGGDGGGVGVWGGGHHQQ